MTKHPAINQRPSLATVKRYFRNPKGLLILVLGSLTAVAALGSGTGEVVPGVFVAVGFATLIDAPILRLRKGRWVFPDGALLTGLIVAMILSSQAPWHVAAFAATVGVASKYLFRTHTANGFNPAALALLAAYAVFRSGQSWWGALPDLVPPSLGPAAFALLMATGLLVADRVRRLPAALAFLGIYYLLFTLTAYLADPVRVVAIFRSSDLHAAVFCAFFMVTDPPTSPAGYRDQVVFGATAAASAYAVFESVGAIYYLLVGLLVANTWEAWRRWRAHLAHHPDSRRAPTAAAHTAHRHSWRG